MTEQTNPSSAPPEILIVEDSPVEAELLRRCLARAGHPVTMTKDGKEGLQAARARRPALVVSDIRMPLMDGYQLCREIKYDEALWNTPVILLTILSEAEDIMEAINSGADSYITKPFVEASLLERIRALLATPIRRKRAEERRSEKVEYNGKPYTITGGSQQVLNLLLSVYENTLAQNRDLTEIQIQLNLLNESLDDQVRERTAELVAEEQKLKRANRALMTLSAGNEALVRTTSEQELLQSATRVIVEIGGYRMARVSYADDNPEKSLRRVAWAGVGEDFNGGQSLTWADIEKGQVPIALAIRSSTPHICQDIASDPHFAPWKDAALAQGYASNIGLPLSDGRRTFGGLSIYSSEKDAFNEEESRLLMELANDLAYGIATLRTRAEREQAEKALHESEESYRKVTETARDAIITLDGDGGVITTWNPAAEAMFGYSQEEVIGRSLHEFLAPPRFREEAMKGMEHFDKTGEGAAINKTLELTALHKNGTEFPIELSQSAMNIHGKWYATGIARDITERKQVESQLAEQLEELRRWHEATLGREMRSIELKHEVNELLGQAGQPPRYPSAEVSAEIKP